MIGKLCKNSARNSGFEDCRYGNGTNNLHGVNCDMRFVIIRVSFGIFGAFVILGACRHLNDYMYAYILKLNLILFWLKVRLDCLCLEMQISIVKCVRLIGLFFRKWLW